MKALACGASWQRGLETFFDQFRLCFGASPHPAEPNLHNESGRRRAQNLQQNPAVTHFNKLCSPIRPSTSSNLPGTRMHCDRSDPIGLKLRAPVPRSGERRPPGIKDQKRHIRDCGSQCIQCWYRQILILILHLSLIMNSLSKSKKMNGRTPSGKSAQVGPIEDLLRFRDRFRTLSISTLHWVIFKVPVGSKKRISSMHQPDSSVWQKVQ